MSAFTAGHPLSLAAVSLGWVRLPTKPVAVLVAVSIAVARCTRSASRATRRGVDRRALRVRARHRVRQTILDLHLDRGATLSAVLGSNAGVELAQSVAVAIVLPLVVLMSRSRAYTAVRVGLAALRAAAAGAWVVTVLLGGESVLQPAFDVVRAHPLAALVVLASSAAAL